jgi:signal transduction histidine kinase
MSFAEGDSASRSFSFSDLKTPLDVSETGQVPDTHNQHEKGAKDPQTGATMVIEDVPQQYAKLASPSHEPSDRRRSVSDLQESLLSGTTKELFARAAEIMRRSNDMSGVMFMDASYAATGPQDLHPMNVGKHCQILGFATDDRSSLRGDVLPIDMIPCESNFKQVLAQYPQGYSLSCDGVDEDSHFENNSPTEQFSYFADIAPKEHRLQAINKDREQHSARVKALIPGIKSALFLPLWDFERGRWFAGCFCWSTRAERVLDGRLDLPFLKTFGHSIMQEVARLDALATSQSKTTFLSSLSHELRTPLHGILGSAHLMRNSRLDTFQVSMLNSINVCGRTLLETVEHLLDHAERPEKSRNYASITSYGENSICIASERLDPTSSSVDSSATSKCNVGFITEEVVETMIIGEAPFNITVDANEEGIAGIENTATQEIAQKRSRFIILDISDYRGLGFRLSPSSYGRVVMNLFGNALKFTESGFVHISVRSEHLSDHTGTGTVVLKISDSGIGMASSFLQRAFEPFQKQNQHTTGTGVGLAVVKRIIEDIGGQIDIHSEASKGTDIILRLPLECLSNEEGHDPKINPLPVAMAGLKGRKVCILYHISEPNDSPEQLLHKQTLKRYVEVLSATLSNVLQLDIYQTSVWDGSDETEVVICPEVSFDSLQMIRRNAAKAGRRCPATVLIAMDILEAETLRSDARVTSRESIVQSITQPQVYGSTL